MFFNVHALYHEQMIGKIYIVCSRPVTGVRVHASNPWLQHPLTSRPWSCGCQPKRWDPPSSYKRRNRFETWQWMAAANDLKLRAPNCWQRGFRQGIIKRHRKWTWNHQLGMPQRIKALWILKFSTMWSCNWVHLESDITITVNSHTFWGCPYPLPQSKIRLP